jgi:hypothetical protein
MLTPPGMQTIPLPHFSNPGDDLEPNPSEIVLATTGFTGRLWGSLLNFYGMHL